LPGCPVLESQDRRESKTIPAYITSNRHAGQSRDVGRGKATYTARTGRFVAIHFVGAVEAVEADLARWRYQSSQARKFN
jgi:hypothetical protein